MLILFFLNLASFHRQTCPQLLLLFCGTTLLNHHFTYIFTHLNSHTSCLPETSFWRTNAVVQIPYHVIQSVLSFGSKIPFFLLQLISYHENMVVFSQIFHEILHSSFFAVYFRTSPQNSFSFLDLWVIFKVQNRCQFYENLYAKQISLNICTSELICTTHGHEVKRGN